MGGAWGTSWGKSREAGVAPPLSLGLARGRHSWRSPEILAGHELLGKRTAARHFRKNFFEGGEDSYGEPERQMRWGGIELKLL